MNKRKKYKQFIWDVALLGIANTANNFKSLLIIPILTKALGAYNYGIWTQLKISITLLIPFLTLGTARALVKFMPGESIKNKVRDDLFSCFFMSLFFSFLIVSLFFALSKSISVLLFNTDQYGLLIRVSSLLLIFESGNLVLLEYFKSLRYIKAYFQILTCEVIFELTLIILTIMSGYGILGALFSVLAARTLFLLVRLLKIWSFIGFARPSFINIKKYIFFGMPLVFSSLFFFILNWGNRYLINYFLGLKIVGIYSVTYFLAYGITFIASPIAYILYPTLSGCVNQNRISEARSFINYSLKYFFVVGIPLIFGISFFSKDLLIILSSPEFLSGKNYLWILTISIFVFQIGVIGEYVNVIFGRNRLILWLYIILSITNILLTIIFIKTFGIIGVALATGISFAFYSIFNLVYSQRFIRYGIGFITLIKIFTSALIVIACFSLFREYIPNINTVFFLPLGILLYIYQLYLFRFFTAKELVLYRSILLRRGKDLSGEI